MTADFEVVKGAQYILTPKTDSSNRCITIPQFLYYEAVQYFDSLYEPDSEERLFYFTKSYLLIEMGFHILMVSQRLGHEKVETTWQTYAHLYPDKEKMLAAQLDTVKVQGITANLTIEDQLAEFMAQFQSHLKEQPALIDINSEEIIRWDPEKREKAVVTAEEFEQEAQFDEGMDAGLAAAEIFQAGYLEVCGIVYFLASRGLLAKFL